MIDKLQNDRQKIQTAEGRQRVARPNIKVDGTDVKQKSNKIDDLTQNKTSAAFEIAKDNGVFLDLEGSKNTLKL